MKLPKTLKRYCPFCKKHTEHTLSQAKKRTPYSAHPMSKGTPFRQKQKQRGKGIGQGNTGKFNKKAKTKWKMSGASPTKLTDFRYKCKVCGKSHIQKKGIRARKLEIK